jgi:hypothetical protein
MVVTLTTITRHASSALAPQLDTHLGQHPGPVELEGVVDEGTTVQVAPDEYAAPAEPRFRRERIDGTEMVGGGRVAGDTHRRNVTQSPCRFPGTVLT